MEGIRVHTRSPITTATKPSGITPQTVTAPTQNSPQGPASNTAALPASPAANSSYLSARPGAPAAPVPTGSIYTSSAYTPHPMPTTVTAVPPTASRDGPPPPQPGAVPTLHTAASNRYTPVPRQPGAGPQPLTNTTTSPTHRQNPQPSAYPPQFATPPPTTSSNYPGQPASGTATSTAPSGPYPVRLPNPYALPPPPTTQQQGGQRSSLDHPPGYIQNPNAVEPSPYQRDATQRRSTYHISSAFGNVGQMGGSGGEEGVWDTVKGWVKAGVETVGSVEEEVWRRINR